MLLVYVEVCGRKVCRRNGVAMNVALQKALHTATRLSMERKARTDYLVLDSAQAADMPVDVSTLS